MILIEIGDNMNEKWSTVLEGFPQLARKAASEGIVLLKNNDKVLPIKKDDIVSVFGRCQIDYYRSGTGSGGAVHVPYTVNAIEGMKGNKAIRLNESLLHLYETFLAENPFDNGGGGWAAEPWFQKEMPLTDEIIKDAASKSNKAVVIIGRTAGEDQDNNAVEGSYYLTSLEERMVEQVTEHFENVIIVLNVTNIIDMNFTLNNPNIKAIMYSWAGGLEGGNALADVLSGDVAPSGKLANTIPYKLEDYPTFRNFGNKFQNIYEEDIYVGYRYFETFQKEQVLYPFGFGLAYSRFDIDVVSSKVQGEGINKTFEFTVLVSNVGEYKGKEVVQVYVEAPQGKLGKPVLELKAFKKTSLLQVGDKEELIVSIPFKDLASYDDGGATGYKSAYVVEEGLYQFRIGNSIRNHHVAIFDEEQGYLQTETVVVEQLEEALAPVMEFKRFKPGEEKDFGEFEVSLETVPTRTIDMKKRIYMNLPKDISYTGDCGIKLQDVRNEKHSIEDFVAQLTVEEMAIMIRGEGMSSPKVTPGVAAAFGGNSKSLLQYGIPVAAAADGPSGIRMDTGRKATQLPIGTLLACSFNEEVMLDVYKAEGQELLLNEIDTLLGPGVNIHRHPLNGRNFEYYSEDPYLSGVMAKSATLGMHLGGSSGTLKHFACNDQESHRFLVDAVVSERALREIHLKPFEMAVKEGKAVSIMTAYNPINGIWSASNYDLNTTILRKEWGYKGLVMTDWWANMNNPIEGGKQDKTYASYMLRSQNDLYMVVENFGAEKNILNDDIVASVKSGDITIGELQRSVINILNFILQAPVIEREIKTVDFVTIYPDSSLAKEEIDGDNPMYLNTKTNTSYIIDITSNGVYRFDVKLRNEKDELAQSSCNVLLNGTYVTSITQNGTNGLWKEDNFMVVNLGVGRYSLELEFTMPGIEIEWIKHTKTS